jgi:transposase
MSWGLEHRTLVYPIDAGLTRLLRMHKERNVETIQGFFSMLGGELTSMVECVCSDMWKPWFRVISEKTTSLCRIIRAGVSSCAKTI